MGEPKVSFRAVPRVLVLILLILSSARWAAAQTPNTIATIVGGGTNPTSPTAAFLPSVTGTVKDSSNNVYVVVGPLNVVYKITPAGQMSVFAGTGIAGFSGDGGPAASAELYNPIAIALDGAGDLYIADQYNNRIRRVDATTGVITTFAGTGNQYDGGGFFGGYSGDSGPATSAMLNEPSSLAFDANGNLFVADAGNEVIRRIDNTTSHIITTYAGNGTPGTPGTANGDGGPATSAQLNAYFAQLGVAVDSTGNLYIADAGDSVVRKVDTSASHIITTFAGSPSHTFTFSGNGGPANQAGLNTPFSLYFDGSGNLLIADTYNGVVRKVDTTTNHIITTFAGGSGSCLNLSTGCGDGGLPTSAVLNRPYGVFVDSTADTFISDYGSGTVRKVTAGASLVISTFAGGGTGGLGGTATSAIVPLPYTVASDPSGNLFVLDNYSIARFNTSTNTLTDYAGNGVEGVAIGPGNGDGGAAATANLFYPGAMALDSSENFYFGEWGRWIRRVNATTGVITTYAGTGNLCNATATPACGDGGPATSATFGGQIDGIATDSGGNVYVADALLNRIRRIDATTGMITNYAGTGASGYTGDGGPATAATFSYPTGIAFDSAGNMYVADSGNNVIRMIDNSAAHNVTTYAFNGLPTFGGDGGDALSASMQFPEQVAVDAAGNLFVGAGYDNVVRRIDNGEGGTERSIITVAGDVQNLDGGFGGDGGPSTQALLSNFGVAVDAHHNLYIADAGNNRIRKVHMVPAAVVTPVLPTQFGPVFAGSSSASGEVLFGNTGLDDLQVNNVTVPAGFTVTTCNGTINSFAVIPGFNDGCEIVVTFAPAAGTPPGTITGNLTFTTNDPANPSYSFPLSGVVAASPGVTLSVSLVGSGIVESTPSGIVCENTGGTCSDNFPTNDSVTLDAVPLSGYSFSGWTVNGSSTVCPGTSVCTITITAATAVVATFTTGSTSPSPTLTVAGAGTGNGTITSSPAGINCTITGGVASGTCSFSGFAAGTTNVVLTATAASGSKFAGWLTTLCGLLPLSEASGPCRFTLAYASLVSAPQVTALFSGPPQPFAAGQIFVGTYAGTILVYNPNGTLAQVLSSGNLSPNSAIYGMNFDATGNLYAASPSASGVTDGTVEFFANDGSGPTTFGVYTAGQPSDVLFDPSGNAFVGGASGTTLGILEFAGGKNGAPTKTFYPADESNTSDNGVYVDLLDDNASMLYTDGGNWVGNFDILNNHQNPDFADNLPGVGAYQIRELSDKTVLVADTNEIVRLSASGSVIQTYTPGVAAGAAGTFYALALDPSGSSFWTGDGVAGKVYQVRVSDGAILNTINTGLTFAAANSPTIFGLAVLGSTSSGAADVSVTMTGPASSVLQNSPMTFTIIVKNNGPSTAANVTVTDPFPTGITISSAVSSLGTCAGTTTVTCTLGTMTSGQTALVTLTAASSLAGTLFNTVNATTTTPDPNANNNSAGTSTTVLPAATLQVVAPFSGSGRVTDNLGLINCVSTAGVLTGTCIGNYATGTEVTLTGTPSSGSTLSGWYPCSGTGSCVIEIGTSPQVAEVFFTPGVSSYTLTLTDIGTGTGKVTDNTGQISCSEASGVVTGTCSASYTGGTLVTLTESVTSPSTFGGWGGACASSGTATTCGFTITANTAASADFVPPPVSENLTFPAGVNPPPQQAVFNCPSNSNPTPANPCTDPNAYSAQLALAQVNSSFTITVTAVEVPPSQYDGLCETGNTVTNDFDCRFSTFFNYGTDANGNAIVPYCYPYANGNCVHYEVYQGTPGNEPDPSLYSGPVNWQIAFNNDTFVPPTSHWSGSQPQFYDDPDYAPTPTSAVGSLCTQPMTINGVPQSYSCQFEFDITTFVTPGQLVDTLIGGTTKQLNDVVIAFPPSIGGQLNVTTTPDAATASAGQAIGFTVAVTNAGPGSETGVTLSDPLPAGASWTISPAYGGPGSCSIGGTAGSQVLNCTLGTLGNGATASVHVSGASAAAGVYTSTTTVTVGNQQILSIAAITVSAEASSFSSLTASQTIPFGTPSVTLSGVLSGAGPEYPASGETVSVTIDGVTHTTTTGTNGAFTLAFPTSTIPASTTPYTITYSYTGDSDLKAASNSSSTLTVTAVTPTIAIQLASTSPVALSENGNGYTVALTLMNSGNTAANVVVTGATLGASSTPAFPAGNSATVPAGGTATVQITFTPSAGAAGASVPFKASGTYAGGSLSGNWSVSVRSVKLP